MISSLTRLDSDTNVIEDETVSVIYLGANDTNRICHTGTKEHFTGYNRKCTDLYFLDRSEKSVFPTI